MYIITFHIFSFQKDNTATNNHKIETLVGFLGNKEDFQSLGNNN